VRWYYYLEQKFHARHFPDRRFYLLLNVGIENECETIDEDCAVTQWSNWSPCSVTCGKGMRERQRYYLNKEDMLRCDRTTQELDVCMSRTLDCDEAISAKNYAGQQPTM